MDKGTLKAERAANRALEEFLAKRIADMPSADWKNIPKERKVEFLKAARRALSGFRKYESITAKRQERGEAKRQERLKAKKAAAEGEADQR